MPTPINTATKAKEAIDQLQTALNAVFKQYSRAIQSQQQVLETETSQEIGTTKRRNKETRSQLKTGDWRETSLEPMYAESPSIEQVPTPEMSLSEKKDKIQQSFQEAKQAADDGNILKASTTLMNIRDIVQPLLRTPLTPVSEKKENDFGALLQKFDDTINTVEGKSLSHVDRLSQSKGGAGWALGGTSKAWNREKGWRVAGQNHTGHLGLPFDDE